jgi:adenine-specific DNA methylase
MKKIRTVAYKGSKRKLIDNIITLAREVNPTTVFDGFSGTGIVAANLREAGYVVTANDLNYSSFIFSSVFLKGFDQKEVEKHLVALNNIAPKAGWLTANYSGTAKRVIRGTNNSVQERPLGFLGKNARKLDAAREYVQDLQIGEEERNALIFSIVLAADKVFNNSNDQKSSLKEWSPSSKKDVVFLSPTLVKGPQGSVMQGDILKQKIKADFVYFDPPYTSGVLYESCYHLNDSIAKWGKEELDYSYAIPRPKSKCFKKDGKNAGNFYSKKEAPAAFDSLLSNTTADRIVISYSDAPRNAISLKDLQTICQKHGEVSLQTKNHRICMQPKKMKKISQELKEAFMIIDRK